MRCEEVMELIQRNLDNDLSSSESDNMHEHLRSCQECQSLHESLSQLSLDLENLPDIEPPFSIVDRILPQLEVSNQMGTISIVGVQPHKEQPGLRWKRWALMAGSVAAVLAIWISADNLWTSELEPSKVQFQSAADQSTVSPDPKPEHAAQSEVAMNSSLEGKTEQKTENQTMMAKDDPSAVPIEKPAKQAAQPQVKEEKMKPKENAVTLQPTPEQPSKKAEADVSKTEAVDQQPAEQQMAMAPQEKAAPVEQMPSIAAIQPPTEEEASTPHVAVAPLEPSEQIHTFMAPELSDTNIAATRGEASYPSPTGDWMAQVDGQTVVIFDQSGMEVFRSHPWPADMEVKVEWLDEYLLQYTLVPKNIEENKSISAEAETWRINIPDKQEQKQSF